MEEITYRIHWLAFTVHANMEDAFTLYDVIFKEIFGELEPLGHGGRGFKEIQHALLEFKIYLSPVSGNGSYFHIEIPGSACDALEWQHFQALGEYLKGNFPDKYKFTRLDFAFDHVPFSPEQIEEAIGDNNLRSLAKRETLKIHASPYAPKENGEIGTYTVELGSMTSERMITVYNKRGYTRLEFQMKDDRAQLVTCGLLSASSESLWFSIVISHLLDYVDFKAPWWNDFVSGHARAGAKISDPREITVTKIVNWLDFQVAPALSVAIDILPKDQIDNMLRRGRRRRGARYQLLLDSVQK